ncbi:Transmembrane protein DDB_G0269096 [Hondaea fermentalgiana]|uniref:Transmembrane protein DDB_G0269096 n=1 Tax=Hondaea fermentalgiana TaxID=2315210 RepID=A0A2R5GUL1_9STRA|nr:Transmembrane protein DDB_G0269096 [Hondaea fermentalgiana]|eukprot:GBG34255.1 Transmembrane protein DDB_G0269096 [Hondaea fermentalgiana]
MILKSGLGGLVSAGLLSAVHFGITDAHDMTMILGSFGATSVLLFAAPVVPFSQPRNVIGGHLISAFVGVSALKLCGGNAALAVPLACGASIMAMQATNTVHPPAGGTALIAVMGSPALTAMGYGLLVPTGLGSGLLVASAVLYNNTLRGAMRYPQYWY